MLVDYGSLFPKQRRVTILTFGGSKNLDFIVYFPNYCHVSHLRLLTEPGCCCDYHVSYTRLAPVSCDPVIQT